jgi:hypothetical protein
MAIPLRVGYVKDFCARRVPPAAWDRVGRGVTPAALSLHRTCGSAYGGSTNTREPLLGGQQRDQPQAREVRCRECEVHMTSPSVPPRAIAVTGRPPRLLGSQTSSTKFARSGPSPLPLPPEQAAHPSSQPAIELLKYPLGLRQTEVIDSSPQ